jgi:uncharacterized membrane protein YccC
VTGVRQWVEPMLRVNLARIDPVLALRHGLVVAVALAAGFGLDEPRAGFAAAMGALQVGFYDGRGPYRARLETMVAATLALALAATIGAAAHGTPAVAEVLTVGVAFVGGLMTAVGPNASLAGLHSTILILVFSSVASGNPALVGAGVLLGGGLQSLVSLGGWAIRPYGPEERALAHAWASLSNVGAHRDDAADRTALLALADAASTLALSSARGSEGQRLRGLLDRADWLRLELVALDRRADAGAARLRATAAAALRGLAAALAARGPERAATAEAAVNGFSQATNDSDDLPQGRFVAVTRELHEAAGLLDPSWHASGLTPTLRRRQGPRDVLGTVRSAAAPGSPLFRHAARLAVAVAAAHVIAGALHLERGYWVAMTAIIILRPDYSSTVQRGLGRLGGTFAGVLIAWGIVSVLTPGRVVLVVLVGAFATATYLTMRANFALGATSLTALIACLLEVEGQPLAQTAPTRLLDTAVGGTLALAVYFLLPTWQRFELGEALAGSIEASLAYATAVLLGLADPGTYDAGGARRLGAGAARARAEAEAAVEGARGEPGKGALSAESAAAVLAANRRLNRALVSLEVVARSPSRARPALTHALERLTDALDEVSARLRGDLSDVPGAGAHAIPDNWHLDLPEADRADPVDVEVGRAMDATQALLDLTRSAGT